MEARKYGKPQLSFARKSLPAGREKFYGNEGGALWIHTHILQEKKWNKFVFISPFLILVREEMDFGNLDR